MSDKISREKAYAAGLVIREAFERANITPDHFLFVSAMMCEAFGNDVTHIVSCAHEEAAAMRAAKGEKS